MRPVSMRRHGAGPSVPDQVLGLTALAVSSSQINLSWNAAATAQSYTIRRDGVQIANLLPGTTYSDLALNASTAYAYKVSAVNTFGEGLASAIASATTQAGTNVFPPTAPAITNLTATGTADPTTILRATHTAVTSTDHYAVQRRATGATIWNRATAFDHTGTVIDITGNTPGASVDVQIAACNASESVILWSPTASATLQTGAGGLSAPFPFWTAMSLIGGNRTGYATAQYRQWAALNALVLMGWLPGMDFSQGASMFATMQNIANRSTINTICGLSHDVQIIGNPGLDSKFWNMISGNKWLLYSSYPNGTPVAAGSNFYTNLTAGGNLNSFGENLQRYDARFQNAYMIAGDQSVVTSQNNVANPLVAFINSDDRFCTTPVTGDWGRVGGSSSGSALDTALRNGNVALDAALRAATGKAICCNIGRLNGFFGPYPEYLANKTEYGYADQQIGTGFTYEYNNDRTTFVTVMNNLSNAVSRLAGAAHFNVRPDGSDPISFDTSPSRNPTAYSAPHQGARHAMCAFAVLSDLGYGASATQANDCNQTPIWWDYQSVNLATRTAYTYPNVAAGLGYLGNWIDPPQSAPQPGTTGFRRRAINGEVWWFSRRDPAGTVNFGRTLHKIFGPQNPGFDDGSPVTQYAYQPRDGFLGLY